MIPHDPVAKKALQEHSVHRIGEGDDPASKIEIKRRKNALLAKKNGTFPDPQTLEETKQKINNLIERANQMTHQRENLT